MCLHKGTDPWTMTEVSLLSYDMSGQHLTTGQILHKQNQTRQKQIISHQITKTTLLIYWGLTLLSTILPTYQFNAFINNFTDVSV